MNLTQLTYFNSLAESQHYAASAEALGVAQSSLSRAMASLEQELGVPLFEKSGRNICLTKYGRAFAQYVRQGLAALNLGAEVVRSLADPERGEINVGMIFSLGPKIMPELVRRFGSQPAFSGYRLHIAQASTEELLAMLLADRCDLILCSPPSTSQERVRLVELRHRQIVAVVSEHHPLAQRGSATLKEVLSYPLILSADQSAFFLRLCRERGLTPDILSQVQGECAAAGLAAVNYGVAILHSAVSLEGQPVRSVALPELAQTDFPLYMAYLRDRWYAPAVLAFRDFVLKEGC